MNAVGWIAASTPVVGWLVTLAITIRWFEQKDRAAREATAQLAHQIVELKIQERRHLKQIEAWQDDREALIAEWRQERFMLIEMLRTTRGGPLQ